MGMANAVTINGDMSIIALASARGTNCNPEKNNDAVINSRMERKS
tara:strand:+ start:62 stop:196 length:135 start_codon:yes stop_codon:yes gene_type:complete